MKNALGVLLIGFLALQPFGILAAEQTGEIRGKVSEENGEALPGVAITARSSKLQGVRTALSDRGGNFRLPLLPVGSYELTFDLPGFVKMTLQGQEVHLGAVSSLTIVLRPAAVSEELTVTAAIPLIDKVKADTSYRATSEELARIPNQARTIAGLVEMAPGVTGVRTNTVSGGSSTQPLLGSETGLPSIRGEGDMGNNWLVDGLSMKGVSLNDPGIRVNYDAWEEVQIVSDGFSPENGQGTGGFINIVTKSGGNSFHGEFGALVQDSHLRAEREDQLSVVSVPESSHGQYFGNVGGPLAKDKVWFFLSNNFFTNADRSAEGSLGWLVVPAGSRNVSTNNLYGKVTFRPSMNHMVSFSGTLDKLLHQTGGIGMPETYTKDSYEQYFYRFNYQGVLSQNTLLTAALGQFRDRTESEPLSGDYGPPSYYWQDIGQYTNNAFGGWWASESRTDLVANIVHYLDLGRWGDHELGAGVSYYAGKIRQTGSYGGLDADPWPGNGFDNGVSITWAEPGHPITLQEFGPSEANDSTRGFGFHAEDSVVLGRFSLMVGLRTDTQQIFNDVGDLIINWGAASFLQPRLSCAVDLGGDGRNVIKAAYGLFSMPLPGELFSFLNSNYYNTLIWYSWSGPDDPTDVELKQPENWTYQSEQSAQLPLQLDPHLKPEKLNRWLLEYDHRLGRFWVLKVRGVLSSSRDLLDDVGFYDPDPANIYERKYVFMNFELKKRDYRALEVELNARVPGRLTFNASYTWSQAKGTSPGNYFEGGTWGQLWGNAYNLGVFGDRPYMPEGAVNKDLYDRIFAGLGGVGIGDEGWYGFLPYSVDHAVKISGTYVAPFGIYVGTIIEYLSGYHWEKRGWCEVYSAYFTFPEGRGGRATPGHMYVDLAIDKEFMLSRGVRLGLGVDVYNLMNGQRPVSYVKSDNDIFGQIWARQLPRWTQVRATFRF